jgi:hypothetical protein
MRMTRRRVSGFSGVAGAAVVALGIAAYACTNLATLNLSTAAGRPGDTITVTGSSFASVCICGPQLPPTPVKIRWHGVQGEVMAEVMPEKSGSLSAAFNVPETKPGYYVIAATQHDATFDIDVAGTPALATFEVLGPNGQSVVGSGESAAANAPADQSTSTGLIAFTIGLGALGFALFVGGSAAVFRQVATRKARVPAVVKRD